MHGCDKTKICCVGDDMGMQKIRDYGYYYDSGADFHANVDQ